MFHFYFFYFRADTHKVQSISCSFALVLLVFVVNKKKKKKNMSFFSLALYRILSSTQKKRARAIFAPHGNEFVTEEKIQQLILYFTRSSKTLGNSMMTKKSSRITA